jgi:hypothetical protein
MPAAGAEDTGVWKGVVEAAWVVGVRFGRRRGCCGLRVVGEADWSAAGGWGAVGRGEMGRWVATVLQWRKKNAEEEERGSRAHRLLDANARPLAAWSVDPGGPMERPDRTMLS